MTTLLDRGIFVAACAALAMSACSGGGDVASGSTPAPVTVATTPAPTTPAPTTPAPTVTSPAMPASTSTVTPQTAAPPTSPDTAPPATEPPATGPAETCTPPTGRDIFDDGYPNRMSGMVGGDIRTGAHPCFERVVIEVSGHGDMPGVRVEYVDDPVHLSPSDQTVDIEGDATLVISLAAWMPSMEGDGYAGPTDFHPTNVSHIEQIRRIENFEGLSAWAVGLDRERDFDVSYLDAPARIVVDIAAG